ncbi:ankyrin repeat domain-containing protein [Legionella quateirensis]|uniref:Ankyrin repeats (3 copies) n=1 Tax=Legionella quateirensis TaxID=45072 RepID=A0A378KYI5_9GAMM|nr:ankyrin repeat domain-containing protein [Legionella quateirensis]KTD47574.1 Ankyrin repeats (3 copies) [Legionella quateirensis]STY18671.1 Ankyrin repeats (3 copies) [Legionella quateirensis]
MSDPRERQIALAAEKEQSTHDRIVSNAAASLAIRLAPKYLFPNRNASSSSSSSSATSRMSLSAEGNAAAQARMKHIRERYVKRETTSLLTDTTKSWLATTLLPRPLNPELDRVTLVRTKSDSEISEEWYLPLPEVYAIVLSALIDTDVDVWPVPPGSSPKNERGLRLQEFDRINNALATAYPPICPTGIRHSWLMALNGYEGKRLPLNADDLLFRGLFDFMAHKVLGEQMKIALPEGRDPTGEERQVFNKQFQPLFLPWIFEGMPKQVEEAIVAAGGAESAQALVLSRFHDIETLPDKGMMNTIQNYCTMEGLKNIPCNFTPLLAALNHPALLNAALGRDTTSATGFEQLARELLSWLRGPNFLPETLAETDANDDFKRVYLLIRLLDALHQYQTHKSLLDIGDMPAEDHLAWEDSKAFMSRCLENPALSLQELLSDVGAIERNLRAFERGFGMWRNSTFHDFISNYFANWFAAAGDNEITVRANLFTKLFELFLQDCPQQQDAKHAIHVSDRMLTEWTGQMNADGVLEITPYQINRILLHALCYSKDTWSDAFQMNLRILLQFLRNRFNEAQGIGAQTLAHDSYPDELLDYIANSANGVAPDTISPMVSPGNITPATSLDIVKLLAVSMDTPEAVIQTVVKHPNFNPDAVDDDGLTPFYLAAEQGNIPLASALLSRDVDYLVQFNGYLPLSTALHNGHLSFVLWFLGALPDDKRAGAVMEEDGFANTVLIEAAINPESLRLLLTSLSETAKAAAVMIKLKDQSTILHLAASNPVSLKLLLDCTACLPEDTRTELLMAKNTNGFTVLHYAANNPKSLKLLLDCLGESERTNAVMVTNRIGSTVLHEASNNPKSLKLLLRYLPKATKAAAVMAKDINGYTSLHRAAKNPESLRLLLTNIPQDERAAAVNENDRKGETVIDLVLGNPESLNQLLICLPEKARVAVVMAKNWKGETLLHRVAANPDSLRLVLASLPEDIMAAAIMEKNRDGETVLDCAFHNPKSMHLLWPYLTKVTTATLLMDKKRSGNTILHISAIDPKFLELILTYLPEQTKAAKIMEKNQNGETVLLRAANNPESLKLLLACFPENERAAALMTKDKYDFTALHYAANNPESLKLILACLSEDTKSTAVMAKNRYGKTVLDYAARNEESLSILQAYATAAKSTAASSSPSFFSHDHSSQPSSSEKMDLDSETSQRPRR